MDCPTLVIESGWSESRPQLHHDRDLWLIGGQGSVQVVLVIKWTKNPVKQVKGDIEVFELDPLGNVRSIQQEVSYKFSIPSASLFFANGQHHYHRLFSQLQLQTLPTPRGSQSQDVNSLVPVFLLVKTQLKSLISVSMIFVTLLMST
jgi:hypothetical protein